MRIVKSHLNLILILSFFFNIASAMYASNTPELDVFHTFCDQGNIFYKGKPAVVFSRYVSSVPPREFVIKSLHPAEGEGFKIFETFFASSLSNYHDSMYYEYEIITHILPMETGTLVLEPPYFEISAGEGKTRFIKDHSQIKGEILPFWYQYRPVAMGFLGLCVVGGILAVSVRKIRKKMAYGKRVADKKAYDSRKRKGEAIFNHELKQLSRFVLLDDWKSIGQELVVMYGRYLGSVYLIPFQEKDLNALLAKVSTIKTDMHHETLFKGLTGILSEIIYGNRTMRQDEWESLVKRIKSNMQAYVQIESEDIQ